MGDRAMAEIKTEGGSFFVYTHWRGSDLPETATDAVLGARDRWDDYPYANRIIVDQLTVDARDSETGAGLMLGPDAEDAYNDDKPSVIIDLLGKTLTKIRHGETTVTAFDDLV